MPAVVEAAGRAQRRRRAARPRPRRLDAELPARPHARLAAPPALIGMARRAGGRARPRRASCAPTGLPVLVLHGEDDDAWSPGAAGRHGRAARRGHVVARRRARHAVRPELRPAVEHSGPRRRRPQGPAARAGRSCPEPGARRGRGATPSTSSSGGLGGRASLSATTSNAQIVEPVAAGRAPSGRPLACAWPGAERLRRPPGGEVVLAAPARVDEVVRRALERAQQLEVLEAGGAVDGALPGGEALLERAAGALRDGQDVDGDVRHGSSSGGDLQPRPRRRARAPRCGGARAVGASQR